MAGAFQRGGVAPRADAAAAILPFAVWMALMLALPATAGAYAVRSSATLLVALGFSLPWLLRCRTADSRQPTAGQPDSPAQALLPGILGGAAAGVLVAVL